MTEFMINVPKDWGDKQKDELQQKLLESKVFTKDDTVFITNKYTVHQVNTETYDLLEQMKNKLDEE